MIVGIVGSEGAKFTPYTEKKARKLIRELLSRPEVTAVSSGGCHLGGIDIWAEEEAKALDKFDPRLIFRPKTRSWEHGYKPRNLQIAQASTEVHCITIATYPACYKGMKFERCYHCNSDHHIKSGGCWTVKQARQMGKKGVVHVIADELN